jgi:hypothetical protein
VNRLIAKIYDEQLGTYAMSNDHFSHQADAYEAAIDHAVDMIREFFEE